MCIRDRPKDDELQRGIVGYGLSNVVGALLGGLPTATYSQDVYKRQIMNIIVILLTAFSLNGIIKRTAIVMVLQSISVKCGTVTVSYTHLM